MMEICIVKVSLYETFNREEISKQNLWSVKYPWGDDAVTKVKCQKIIYDKTKVLKKKYKTF